MNDHVHLFVTCPPDFSVRKLMQVLKGGTSYEIRKSYPSMKKFKHLWSRGCMYRSIGSVSSEIVRRYIDDSNNWVASK